MVRILTIAGLILLFAALLINPITPLLTTVPVPASIIIPAGDQGANLSAGAHAGWKIAFKDNGMVAQSVDFYFAEPAAPSRGKIIVARNTGSSPEQIVYFFDVTVAARIHVDLPGITVAAETWSFDFIALDSNSAILQARTPPAASGDVYKSITPLGSAAPGFVLSGTKDLIVRGPEARFSWKTQDLALTVLDESQNADTVNVSWGDHTFSEGVPGDTFAHTYASNGTYEVVLNARRDAAHDSAVADITVFTVSTIPGSGDTGSKDLRLPVFVGLVIGGAILLLVGWRLRR
jgi:PKD repeat protein